GYWKPGLPYLDGIEYTIVPNRSTAVLGFIAGKFDMTFPHEITVPLLKDIKSQAPQAICETVPLNVSVTVAVNRKPPFDNIEARRGDGARASGVYRHSRRGAGRCQRSDAAAAGGYLGHPAR